VTVDVTARGRIPMQVNSGNRRLLSEINVTPFVDVMLVLLIIFMVTAPMMMQGVDVNLPRTTTQPIRTEEERLVVTITAKQQIYLNEYQISLESLVRKLEAIYQNQPDRAVLLRADRSVPYGFVVEVMAAVRRSGIVRIGMVTEPPQEVP
jgi:biopolymer transport protein TolR